MTAEFEDQKVSPQYDPKRVEQLIIDFWKSNNTFEKSITTKSVDKPYRFYDGPPFITWLPHYGSLLSSVVKDVVTRYWTQKGKRIDRVWWWDCHGIYVEQKVQEELWYTSNKDIEAKWIEWFIKGCYEFTNDVSDQWEWYVDHVGRWVDFKNAYKTMDNNYMESVLWVFKSLWDKGLIYKGKRVSLYSTKLNTPISNYEVALDNSYADISDPAITVKFPINGGKVEEWNFSKTSDGYVDYALAVVKDAQWRYLSLYNTKWEDRQFPGGKIDAWETWEQAVLREVKEELWVDAVVKKSLWTVKWITDTYPWRAHFFEVELQWEPKIIEPKKHSILTYMETIPSENSLWYAFRGEGVIIDDAEEVMRFFDLYAANHLLPLISEHTETAIAPMNFIAWTTTPWTIPSNLALVVNPELRYIQLFDKASKEYFIIAENLVSKFYKDVEDYILVYRCRGKELLDVSYIPPFDFYTNKWPQHHKVYAADYVTDSDGTGIVHTAPEFGEEDFQTGLKQNLFQTEALDLEWKFTAEVSKYTGMYYRDANDIISKDLKDMWVLLKKESITHSVAMCPRTWVPLIYKAQDAWFINIQSIKQKLFENNEKVHWVPDHLKNGRFLKSMEGAPDRCISRTRFWATPMPVWMSEDNDMIVVGSLAEIYDLDQTGSKHLEKREVSIPSSWANSEGSHQMTSNSWDSSALPQNDVVKTIYRDTLNNKEFDLHRPYVDNIRWMKDGKKYTRIPEVLDPWLESGSMPYAQVHYPFENKEKFEASFPADYVAEYVWQIRAWFFFMHAISTMLTMPAKLEWWKLVADKPVLPLPESKYDSPAFTNVVCTWVLAWNDGRKMSKSLGNYPDPKETMEWFGGDAVRMYMTSSPIVVWWDMNFSEDWLKETYKKFILPLWNSYYFYSTYAGIDKFVPKDNMSLRDILHGDTKSVSDEFKNPLDRWMLIKIKHLVNTVDYSLSVYDMQTASIALIDFMDDLTNRYIRRSRRRFREAGEWDMMGEDKRSAYTVLYCVLTEVCLISAPFTPFITEYIFKQLTGKESVHLEEIVSYRITPEVEAEWWWNMLQEDLNMIRDMWLTQTIVSLWLSLRWQKKLRVKQPLQAAMISVSIWDIYADMIREELNIKELRVDETLAWKVRAVCKLNARLLGKRYGKEMQWVINEAKSGNFVLQNDGHVLVAEKYDLSPEEFEIEYEKWDVPFDVAIDGSLIVALDDTLTDELRLEWDARDLIRFIQEARKTADYKMDDRIQLVVSLPKDVEQAKDMPFKSDIATLMKEYGELITWETLATLVDTLDTPDQQQNVELEMVGHVWFGIKKNL